MVATGLRAAESATTTPQRVAEFANAVAQGNFSEAVVDLVSSAVNGPLWVADPLLYGLRDALPPPLQPEDLVGNLRTNIDNAAAQIEAATRSLLGLPSTRTLTQAVSDEVSEDKSAGAAIDSVPDPDARVVTLKPEGEATSPSGKHADTAPNDKTSTPDKTESVDDADAATDEETDDITEGTSDSDATDDKPALDADDKSDESSRRESSKQPDADDSDTDTSTPDAESSKSETDSDTTDRDTKSDKSDSKKDAGSSGNDE